ncbi:MAG: DNRLRE domain-containing protein, partial [Jatrophihabitantaceae bacterium]
MVRRLVVSVCALTTVWSTLVAAPNQVLADPVGAPGISDAQSAPDEATAREIATTFGHPVIIDADTSETTQASAQPDGSMQLTESTVPVRVQQDGAWVRLDNSLRPAVDGTLQPAAPAVPVQFSAGGSTPLARIQAPSGQWLSETWQSGPLPIPQVDGSSVTYPEVYPGVDLKLTATSTGMSEVLVVKSAEAAANPALASVGFGVDDGSMTTSTEPGGTAIARSSDGTDQLASTTATWWDSSSPGASAAGPGGLGLPVPIAHTSTSDEITVDAASVASTPNATYPVYVDPSWTGGRVAWAFVDSAYPTTAYWKDSGATDSYQHVGHISAGQSDDGNAHTTRSYWQLDTSALNSKYIKSASFNTTETYSFSCTAREVDLYYAHSVTPSSTWHDQPGLITKLDSHNVVAHGYNSNCGPAAVGFDATAGVQAAAAGNADTVTLALVAKDEADEYGWKKFDSVASMIVTYENYPQVPAGRAVTPCWAQCAEPTITRLQNPGVQAVSFINESNPPSLLYRYQVCSGWSSTAPGACQPFFTDTKAFGVTSAVAVPQQLASVGNYEYRAQACRADDTLVCSGWSGFYEFTVDALPPPTPAVASSDFDLTGQSRKGQELVQGSIQVSPNGSVDDYAYSYSPTAGSAAISSPDCPATYGDVIVSCAGAGGAPVSYSVLPTVPSSNRVVVYAY